MIPLALDTNVIIDLIRGRRPEVRARYDAQILAGRPLVASLVVYHELQYGAFVSADPKRRWNATKAVLTDVAIEPLDESDMLAAAMIRSDLKRAGRPIGPYDVLIAGQAANRGWTLATSNFSEFSRVTGLTIEDWSADASSRKP
ncbi:type II toxin-antitoxin system VapC family toxin [uncultured Caulobacter sp.]|uniref:type II toxin-antitoxin system VapC family toxin n=1 Tax=uncultured Caulobacter sp. TaxID=158749 RepID=UPI00260F7BEF|nr:type II toxin-antitoxin system VapC family toxin [uncultured Caulobacter sp.]